MHFSNHEKPLSEVQFPSKPTRPSFYLHLSPFTWYLCILTFELSCDWLFSDSSKSDNIACSEVKFLIIHSQVFFLFTLKSHEALHRCFFLLNLAFSSFTLDYLSYFSVCSVDFFCCYFEVFIPALLKHIHTIRLHAFPNSHFSTLIFFSLPFSRVFSDCCVYTSTCIRALLCISLFFCSGPSHCIIFVFIWFEKLFFRGFGEIAKRRFTRKMLRKSQENTQVSSGIFPSIRRQK